MWEVLKTVELCLLYILFIIFVFLDCPYLLKVYLGYLMTFFPQECLETKGLSSEIEQLCIKNKTISIRCHKVRYCIKEKCFAGLIS